MAREVTAAPPREDAEAPRRVPTLVPASGAEVSGVDLSVPLDERVFGPIERALVAHHVIFFANRIFPIAISSRESGYPGLAALF